MDFLNKLFSQLGALWGRWSTAQRVGITGAAVIGIATVAGVGLWASTPEYVFVTDHLGPQQAAEMVSILEAANISYQLNYSGSAISVPQSEVSRARLALKDVLVVGPDEPEDLGAGIWTDPALQEARLTRQLEQRLARSIQQISAVRAATVHLTLGESSPFIREGTPSKASVILDLNPNSNFSGSDARSIVSLVSHSVEKLTPENVSVMDTSGRLLSSSQGLEADVTGQLSYRSRVEQDLASKAEAILTQMLGPGRAVVRVTADIDFTEIQSKEIKYDPESKVKVSETIHSESHASAPKTSGGTPGSSQNLDALAFKSGGPTKIESNTTTFENAKIEDTVHRVPGRINRLTIAAVVQLPESEKSADGKGTAAPILEREQVEKIIKQAVGFDATRQDEIEVLSAPLVGNAGLLALPATDAGWERYLPLARNLSLGLASLVALTLGLLLIRRLKPIVVETESREVLPTESVLRLASLSQQARENPEAVATVIRSWLDQPVELPQVRKSA
jgi:flagellar M-ring protein FliF